MQVQKINYTIQQYKNTPYSKGIGGQSKCAFNADLGNLKSDFKYNTTSIDKRPFVSIYFGKKECTEKHNDWSVKGLYKYNIPCMYCGRILIPPKTIKRLNRATALAASSTEVVAVLTPYEKSLHPVAYNVFQIIKKESVKNPDQNIQEMFHEIAPIYKKMLRKKQALIFEELKNAAEDLPPDYKLKFELFMNETNDRLRNIPIEIPFSPKEFAYKLGNIYKYELEEVPPERKILLNAIVTIAKNMPRPNGPETQKLQHEQLDLIQKKILKFPYKERRKLRKICVKAKSQINKEKIEEPFSRKSFLYDLENKVLSNTPQNRTNLDKLNADLRAQLLSIASKLQTSTQLASAFIVKNESMPAEDIIFELLGESFATIEHIKPDSLGGESKHSNYGHACAKCNNLERSSKNLDEFIQERPKREVFIQNYMNRLIELANNKTFKKLGISKMHIFNIKQALEGQAPNTLYIDTRKLNTKDMRA